MAGRSSPLAAAPILPHATKTGTVARQNVADETYVVRFGDAAEKLVTRACFDVAIGRGGAKWTLCADAPNVNKSPLWAVGNDCLIRASTSSTSV